MLDPDIGTNYQLTRSEKRYVGIIASIAGFLAGLCCFTPVIIVSFGISTVSYAIALTDLLYYQNHIFFIILGLIFLLMSLFSYFYFHEKICSINSIKRNINKIINIAILTFIFFIFVYLIWLYVIVEIAGIILGIW